MSTKQDETAPLAALQRESAMVNDLNGLKAFIAGALHEISRCCTLEDAKTCAELAAQSIAEFDAGLWRPGPGDDPADWRRRR